MRRATTLSLAGLLLLPGLATATEPHVRCTNYDPQKKPLFGETHAHTAYSFDAVTLATKNPPSDAYKYAKGEAIYITDAEGNPTRCAQLVRALDWAALTDHSEFFGELTMCTNPSSGSYDSTTCQNFRTDPVGTAEIWGMNLTETPQPTPPDICAPGNSTCHAQSKTLWDNINQGCGRGGLRQDRGLPVHFVYRLRVDLYARLQQPAPQRDLSQ